MVTKKFHIKAWDGRTLCGITAQNKKKLKFENPEQQVTCKSCYRERIKLS